MVQISVDKYSIDNPTLRVKKMDELNSIKENIETAPWGGIFADTVIWIVVGVVGFTIASVIVKLLGFLLLGFLL